MDVLLTPTSCYLQVSNLLYVDQPVGTGFSYSTDKHDVRHNEEGVSNDLYDFLQVLVFSLSFLYKDSFLLLLMLSSFMILLAYYQLKS